MQYVRFWLFPVFILGFALVHLAKMARMYLVLLEQRMPFRRFVVTYFKTTLVNLIVPFKVGELYRIYAYSKETKVFQVGLLSVLADRFFDTVGLLILLLPFELFITRNVTVVSGILLTFVVFLAFFYKMYEPTYLYLNRYLILHKSSRRSMSVLKGLDISRDWFEYLRRLISGRYSLILLTSVLGWGLEAAALILLAWILRLPFGIWGFSEYIAAIFLSGRSALLNLYTILGAAMIALATVVSSLYYFAAGRRRGGA